MPVPTIDPRSALPSPPGEGGYSTPVSPPLSQEPTDAGADSPSGGVPYPSPSGTPDGGVRDAGASDLSGGVAYPSAEDASACHVDGGTFDLERQHLSSPNLGTIRQLPVLTADWVMEPEIPRPPGTFLQYSTRRCFMEDHVEARVQIQHWQLTSDAMVGIKVMKQRSILSDVGLVFMATYQGLLDSTSDFSSKLLKPLQDSAHCDSAALSETSAQILFHAEADISYLVTDVPLPDADPGDTDYDVYFIATIVDGGSFFSVQSPILKAIRWWANPSWNLGYRKTMATNVEPLIDGEAFFAKALSLFNGAASYIYIQSWSFWLDTCLTGEPGGGGPTVATVLSAAAARGVKVYILLDSMNAAWASEALRVGLSLPNVTVKTSTQPDTTLWHHHSYHEKYFCVDGRVAMVAGIDFMPDRYQSNSHNWRSDFHRFQLQWHNRGLDATLGFNLFDGPFMLWHDTGVLVEGSVVANLEQDFVRRWSEGAPTGGYLTYPTFTPTASNHNVQVVKTDYIEGAGDQGSIHTRGTLDAYRKAILEARHYVYIENQYFNYKGLGDMLVEALGRNSALQVIVVLPFNTEEALSIGAHRYADAYCWNKGALEEREIRNRMYMHGLYLQSELIKRLRAAPGAINRVGIYALAGCDGGAAADMIYPHSKLTLVDDTWAIVGSANTNGRGFVSDGEMNIVIHQRSVVTPLRTALWKEHIGVDLPTRRIRDFFKVWQAKSLSPRDSATDCTCAEVATVHAVKLRNPPKGQAYSGPGNWLPFVDDAV